MAGDKLETIRVTHLQTMYDKDGWQIIKCKAEDGSVLTACGSDLPTMDESRGILHGKWVNNQRFGREFKVEVAEVLPPVTKKGVISYLRSLRIGIGQKRAVRIYDAFGDKVWDVLSDQPNRLLEVEGITPQLLGRLASKLGETRVLRNVLQELSGKCDITPLKAKRIVDAFGDVSVDVIRTRPYALCRVQGFSFPTVDKMAMEMGIAPDDKSRLYASVGYIFHQFITKGHVCVPSDVFLREMLQLVGTPAGAVSEDACKATLRAMIGEGVLRYTGKMLYREQEYKQEKAIADALLRMVASEPDAVDAEAYLAQYQEESGITLADNQAEAVRCCMSHTLTVVTGGPGTGKTTTIKALLKVHELAYGKKSNAVLMAPTGRAARRMSEATGHDASTIHAAIGYSGEEDTGPSNELGGNLIIVDECSMMDQLITYMLLDCVPEDARVVLVGDPDQLPSIGCGNILMDIIQSGVVPTVKLDVIYRQAQESPIIINAHAINEGNTNLWYTKDFKFMPGDSTEGIFDLACHFYCRCVKAYGIDNVVMLNPFRKRSLLSVNEFNKTLQDMINPPRASDNTITAHETEFRPRDKVMQMKNTGDAKNGDIGIIHSIERRPSKEDSGELEIRAIIEFNGNGKLLPYTKEQLADVDLAYCSTVHKSQGSQYETVIIVLSHIHTVSLKRKLLYTAVTRAEKHVALIGEMSAVNAAIKNDRVDERYTLLHRRLQAGMRKKQAD